ncbi:MAG: sigma 54-interacting transcriptional regulator [Deltaproteobacteria bacterium]|nr:sigma 54-interacting transcriptional regulator [Deltaproteobacteria bacterium]
MADDPRLLEATRTRDRRSSPGERRSHARLGVVMPRALATWVTLADKPLVLGRSAGPGIVTLVHETVSRQHAELGWDGEAYTVTDLGSRNGTFVGGIALAPRAPRRLADGDVVTLGDVVTVFEQGLAPADAPLVSLEAIPGTARATRQLRARIQQAGVDPSPVLLLGQTGTGKELLAREVHRLSGRAGAMVACNVAELSPQLVESQLFGHERGAFTGADRAQEGLFRAAHGGTLFLDEIGELPMTLQAKLLRVLQESEVRPVGGTRSVKVDVRIVSATNRDLASDIEADRFRRDLHARLALWEVKVPTLAERKGDLVAWLDRFHALWRARRGLPPGAPLALSVRATEALLLHAWPDNLRGLDRVVHRLAAEVGDSGVVTAGLLEELLPAVPDGASDGAHEGGATASEESLVPIPTSREELEAIMARFDGSVRAVAKHYGRDRRQVYRWLERFGLRGT